MNYSVSDVEQELDDITRAVTSNLLGVPSVNRSIAAGRMYIENMLTWRLKEAGLEADSNRLLFDIVRTAEDDYSIDPLNLFTVMVLVGQPQPYATCYSSTHCTVDGVDYAVSRTGGFMVCPHVSAKFVTLRLEFAPASVAPFQRVGCNVCQD